MVSFKKKLPLLSFIIIGVVGIVYYAIWQNDKTLPKPEDIHEIWWSDIEKAFHGLSGKKIDGSEAAIEKLRGLEGSYVKLFGYMLPLRPSSKYSHFLLSTRTHLCPFCMPANAGSMVEVYLVNKISYSKEALDIAGRFKLSDGKKTGIYFVLEDAHVLQK